MLLTCDAHHKIRSELFFFCLRPQGSVCKVIFSLLWFCSVGKIRNVSSGRYRKVSMGRALRDICDKLLNKVRSKHGTMKFRI